MSKSLKISLFSFVLLAFLGAGFGAGFYLGEKKGVASIPSIEKVTGLSNKEEGKPEGVDFSLFWDGWRMLEESYVAKGSLDREAMVRGALRGLVKSLHDPYTVFFDPSENKKFIDDVSGSFEGIGAEIGIRKNQLIVISPLKDSPAEQAGLKAGDKIFEIDTTGTTDLSLEEAVSKIRGPKNTEVILLIDRDSFEKPKEFKIKRGVIQVPILKLEMKEGVNYLQFYSFSRNASYEFRKAAREIAASGSNKLVLDLRNNPGGYLEVAQDIASHFVPWGEDVVVEDYGDDKKEHLKSRGYNTFKGFKVVVLMNEGSASASEILAGALRDSLGVKLVGQKSFGKGSVQDVEDLKDGSSIKITIAKWLTPKGTSISEVGLEPDYKVEMTEENTKDGKDPQLEKAFEIVKGL